MQRQQQASKASKKRRFHCQNRTDLDHFLSEDAQLASEASTRCVAILATKAFRDVNALRISQDFTTTGRPLFLRCLSSPQHCFCSACVRRNTVFVVSEFAAARWCV